MKKEFLAATIILVVGMTFSLLSAIMAIGTEGLWFARSGSILCLLAIGAQFRLATARKATIEAILISDLSMHKKYEKIKKRPRGHTVLFALSSTTGVIGTLVWGYGDLLYL